MEQFNGDCAEETSNMGVKHEKSILRLVVRVLGSFQRAVRYVAPDIHPTLILAHDKSVFGPHWQPDYAV